jgi:dolichyl-phosphate-mannose-protein mannosyltransferase
VWELRAYPNRILTFLIASALGFLIVFVGVWQTHFRLGSTIQTTLPDAGYYQASEEYKAILAEGRNDALASFPVMIRDSMKYVGHYNKGVPRLDMCKPEENGSPSYFWPFGAKTINYRWAQSGDETRYLYIVPNPVGWALGLLGVFLATAMVLCSWLLGAKIELQHRSHLLLFLGMYWGYMLAVSQLGRVMYLYHYFVPLTLSYLLFGLVFINLQRLGKWKLNDSRKLILLTVLGFLTFLSFQYYRPLSYYLPLTDEDMEDRSLLPLWELRCAKCERENPLLIPRSSN